MVTHDIIKKVRQRIIQSKKALSGSRAGAFKTRLHGFGYDFDQLRDYQQGDDVRFIDWKSSARANKLLLRSYKDERTRTTHLLVDVSGSMGYGTQSKRSHEVALELVAALIIMSEATDDMVGLHFLSDGLEKTIRPKSGKKHSARLMNAVMSQELKEQVTSLQQAFEQFGKRHRRKSLLFIISDFIDENYDTALKALSQRHELALIRVRDTAEESVLQACSGLELEDSESDGQYSFSSAREVALCATQMQQWRAGQDALFKRLQAPCCDCFTDGMHIEQLVDFIHRYF